MDKADYWNRHSSSLEQAYEAAMDDLYLQYHSYAFEVPEYDSEAAEDFQGMASYGELANLPAGEEIIHLIPIGRLVL